jgi:peptidylprolyl isomerase
VIPGFMAQGGDPMGTGEGGSKLPDVPHEFSDFPHVRGVASMARAESLDSANSQFFIMLAPRFVLDHKYSAFGRVIEGMAAVDGIAEGEPPAAPTKIVRATIGGPLPAPPVVAVAAPAPAPAEATTAAQPAAAPEGPPATPPEAAPVTSEQAPPATEQAQPAPAPAEQAPAEPAADTPPQEAPTPQ